MKWPDRFQIKWPFTSDHRIYQAVAPVSVFPISAEDIVDVLLGRLDYTVTYRFDAVEAAFAARGINAACAGADAWDERLLVATRNGDSVTVSPHVGQQLTQGLMTIETLVDMVEALLDLIAGGLATDERHMLFCDERDAWPGLVL